MGSSATQNAALHTSTRRGAITLETFPSTKVSTRSGRPVEARYVPLANLSEMGVEPLNPPRRLLMGSGPSNAEPRVLQALAAPPLAAGDPSLADLLDEISAGLRRLFR